MYSLEVAVASIRALDTPFRKGGEVRKEAASFQFSLQYALPSQAKEAGVTAAKTALPLSFFILTTSAEVLLVILSNNKGQLT